MNWFKVLEENFIRQLNFLANATPEEKLNVINAQINELEKEFGGSFEKLFSQMSDYELDAKNRVLDLYNFRDLIDARNYLLKEVEKNHYHDK